MEYPIVLSPKQVAARLGLSESTLAKMRLAGTGPTFSKLGRRVVYSPKQVTDWIEQNQHCSTSEYGRENG